MCVFCDIAGKTVDAHIVLAEEQAVAFLDHRPLFPGHCLLIPREHYETLGNLPPFLIDPFFAAVRRLSVAVEHAMEAHGTFVAINNRVSQSVPHLHAHIVPRRRKDGLRGFFWPRTRYSGEDEMAATAELIRRAIEHMGAL